jgi:two-component system, OmpR family, KDP operon response regulator KdpE
MAHLLVVDSNTKARNVLAISLKTRGQRVTSIESLDTLAAAMAIYTPDHVLISVSRQSSSATLIACERLRAWSAVPIIVLSDFVDERMKVKMLDNGADDYLVQPIRLDELLARIRAIHRRLAYRTNNASPILNTGDLTVDLSSRSVRVKDQHVPLTHKEYALLKVLAQAHGQLVTYETLLQEIWGREGANERACVRTLVKQLRRKLGENLDKPTYIVTQAGVGYRLQVE